MKTSRLLFVAALVIVALGGVALALFLLINKQRYEGALIGAVLLLGIAQLVAATSRRNEQAVRREEFDQLRGSQESAFHEAQGLRSRVEVIEKAMQNQREAKRAAATTRPKRDYSEIAKPYFAPLHAVPEVPEAPVMPAPRASAPLQNDQLDLYLEPIVTAESNATAHYRAWLWLRGTSPAESTGQDDVYANADRSGLRPALDVFALTRVIPVLRRLSAKGRQVQVFIPIGRATLAAPAYLDEMIRLLNVASDIARLIVLEVEHAAIGELTEGGIKGLAQLGRSGATLGLGAAAVNGIEFAALRNLGFRTIEFTAGPAGVLPAWINAARIASSQSMDVLVRDVDTPEQAETVRRWTRYMCGANFAAPRLVRADVGAEPLRARAA